MKYTHYLACLAALLLFAVPSLRAQELSWARQTDSAAALFTTTDPDGNVIIVGFYFTTTDLDPGPGVFQVSASNTLYTTYIQKLDSNGQFLWAGTFDGTMRTAPLDVKTDAAGNIYILGAGGYSGTADFDIGLGIDMLGTPNGGLFLVRISPTGQHQWARYMDRAYQHAIHSGPLALDTAANIYIAAGFAGTIDTDLGPGVHSITSNGLGDGFLVKYDSSGAMQWTNQLGGTEDDHAMAVATNASGVMVTGMFEGSMDIDPGTGTTILHDSSVYQSPYIIRYDLAGNPVWGKAIQAMDGIWPLLLRAMTSGDLVIGGNFKGTVDMDPGPAVFGVTSLGGSDIFVLKLDSAGSFVWTKVVGGSSGNENLRGMNIGSDDAIYAATFFEGTVDFDPGLGNFTLSATPPWDPALLKLNANGAFEWVAQLEGAYNSELASVAVDLADNIYGIGYFQVFIDVAPAPLDTLHLTAPVGSNTAYVFKWSQDSMITFIKPQQEAHELELYPNPACATLHLRSNAALGDLDIVNMMGQVVWQQSGVKQMELTLDVSGWVRGMCFVRQGGKVRRLVVE